MVKINPSLTIDLNDGQKITINVSEARQIIRDLAKFVDDEKHSDKAMPQATITRRAGASKSRQKDQKLTGRQKLHMSESKKDEILKHFNKQLSAKPKTLTNLLKGISYVPNYLPHIRSMVEGQRNVARKKVGKRTFYSRR